jgi:hypothetical protein
VAATGIGVSVAAAVTVWFIATSEGVVEGLAVALSTATAVAVTAGSDWQPTSKKGNKTINQQQRR